MGIQNRAYFLDKQAAGLRYLLVPALMASSLCYGTEVSLKSKVAPNLPIPASQEAIYVSVSDASPLSKLVGQPQPGLLPDDTDNDLKQVIINADAKGQFRGMVMINNVPMPFLIDTGATDTVIPAKMAVAAKLPYGRYVLASTAGGKVAIRETSISTLKLGDAEVHNLKAQLNDHLHEVLIGMSTLQYFKMSQNGDTMTLLANAQKLNSHNESGTTIQNETSETDAPRTANIKKTVSCDARKVCTTKYSDR